MRYSVLLLLIMMTIGPPLIAGAFHLLAMPREGELGDLMDYDGPLIIKTAAEIEADEASKP